MVIHYPLMLMESGSQKMPFLNLGRWFWKEGGGLGFRVLKTLNPRTHKLYIKSRKEFWKQEKN
jgi:hypothetical protein